MQSRPTDGHTLLSISSLARSLSRHSEAETLQMDANRRRERERGTRSSTLLPLCLSFFVPLQFSRSPVACFLACSLESLPSVHSSLLSFPLTASSCCLTGISVPCHQQSSDQVRVQVKREREAVTATGDRECLFPVFIREFKEGKESKKTVTIRSSGHTRTHIHRHKIAS